MFEFCESSEKVFEFACVRIFVVVRGSNRKREGVEEGRNFPSSKRRRFGKGWRSRWNVRWGRSLKENLTRGFLGWRRGLSRRGCAGASAAAVCGGGGWWWRVLAVAEEKVKG